MIISEKSKMTIDACRFCWMCRHICPIGNVTGQERNNARGRALSLSLVERKAIDLAEVIDNVYECTLCGACTGECVTGWDPVAFTKEVRLEVALNGITPKYIVKLLDNIEECGNPYGIKEMSKKLVSEIEKFSKKQKILLFLGQDARYKVPSTAINAIRLLKRAGVEFTVLINEPDSGWAMETLIGAAEESRQIMTNAARVLSEFETIIAFDPCDAKIFLREYREWGIDLNSCIKTFPKFLEELINTKALSIKKLKYKAVFQDPAALSRDLLETEPERAIMDACTQRYEMLLHGKDTVWAGNLLMKEWIPKVIKMTAKKRWEWAKDSGAELLVTASPSEWSVLNEVRPENMKLMTLEELVLEATKEEAEDA